MARSSVDVERLQGWDVKTCLGLRPQMHMIGRRALHVYRNDSFADDEHETRFSVHIARSERAFLHRLS